MDRHRALAVLYYNYPFLTVETDYEWVDEMIEFMTDDPKADKREVCNALNLKYPPEWWMRAYFEDGLVCSSRSDRCSRDAKQFDIVVLDELHVWRGNTDGTDC